MIELHFSLFNYFWGVLFMNFNIIRSLSFATLFTAIGVLLTPSISVAKSNIVIGLQQEPTSLDPTSDATASID